MPHPNEDILANLYQRFARGELAGVFALCDDAIEFHVPGSTPF